METKWCEDCTFYRKNTSYKTLEFQELFAYCKHPNSIVQPVSRSDKDSYQSCSYLRNSLRKDVCGKEGKWYVPKIPLVSAWPTEWDQTRPPLRCFGEAVIITADPIEKEGFFKRLFKCLAK